MDTDGTRKQVDRKITDTTTTAAPADRDSIFRIVDEHKKATPSLESEEELEDGIASIVSQQQQTVGTGSVNHFNPASEPISILEKRNRHTSSVSSILSADSGDSINTPKTCVPPNTPNLQSDLEQPHPPVFRPITVPHQPQQETQQTAMSQHMATVGKTHKRREFTVVPVEAKFARGRWQCWDYSDSAVATTNQQQPTQGGGISGGLPSGAPQQPGVIVYDRSKTFLANGAASVDVNPSKPMLAGPTAAELAKNSIDGVDHQRRSSLNDREVQRERSGTESTVRGRFVAGQNVNSSPQLAKQQLKNGGSQKTLPGGLIQKTPNNSPTGSLANNLHRHTSVVPGAGQKTPPSQSQRRQTSAPPPLQAPRRAPVSPPSVNTPPPSPPEGESAVHKAAQQLKEVVGATAANKGNVADVSGLLRVAQHQHDSAYSSRDFNISAAISEGVSGIFDVLQSGYIPPHGSPHVPSVFQQQTANTGGGGANLVAIDSKIEQAMDLVKTHLMYAVREEVDILRAKIADLENTVLSLETENAVLREHIGPEVLAHLATLLTDDDGEDIPTPAGANIPPVAPPPATSVQPPAAMTNSGAPSDQQQQQIHKRQNPSKLNEA